MLSRLPILYAQIKAGNYSEKLKKEMSLTNSSINLLIN